MATPIRLRLSRARGFDLQALSQAVNGLPALRVTRPGPFCNPFAVVPVRKAGAELNNGYIAVPTPEDAVACFREMWRAPKLTEERRILLARLRGHNVACWFRPEDVCHGDAWLEMLCEEAADAEHIS
jgi:hypothetical protein